MAELMNMNDLLTDKRFEDQSSRKQHEDALDSRIAAWCANKTAEEVTTLLQSGRVAAAAVISTQNLVDDPHLQARGFFEWAPGVHRDLVMYPLTSFRLSGIRQGVRWPAPMLGEHNEVVLKEKLGLTEVEIQSLSDQNIIGTVPII